MQNCEPDLDFFSKKFFSYISGKMELLYPGKWNFLALSLKTSYISGGNFLNMKNEKNELWKKSLYFLKKSSPAFSALAWNFSLKKNSYIFLKITALKKFLLFSQKKFFLYFRKWNFLATSLKNFYIFFPKNFFLYFWREISELKKLKNSNQKTFFNIFLLFSKKNSYI